nr:disease resistance-like protein DSC1 [Quercus suber]
MRYINMVGCCSLEPSPGLLSQSSLPRPYSSPFFRGYDESSGGVAFTILKRHLQGLFCEKTGYETATKRKEDGSKIEFQIIIPGCLVPRWFTHQSRGNSISVVLPPKWCDSRWMGFTLCALFNEKAYFTGEYRACVKAIGDMPDSQYVFKNLKFGGCGVNDVDYTYLYLFHNDWFSTVGNSESKQIENHVWLLYLSRDDWFSTVGNGECSEIEVVFEYVSDLDIPSSPVKRCGVSLVYEQDMELMEELNQANAQFCSSSRVITFEGWDGFHHGYVNSKRSRDECDDECDDEFDDD